MSPAPAKPVPLPADLPETFSLAEGRANGLSDRRLRALLASGTLTRLGRGIYRRADAPLADEDLLEIAARAPEATLCLMTALSRHDLTDRIPSRIDVALPRERRPPRVQAPVRWHRFDAETFDMGRTVEDLGGGLTLGLYGPTRCIVDAFRLRHLLGDDVAIEALRRWLRRRGAQPSELLVLARRFPKAEPSLRAALQVLL